MDETTRVSLTDFSKEVGRYSVEKLGRLKRGERRVYAAGELPDALVEAVGLADVDERYRHLDRLVADWTP